MKKQIALLLVCFLLAGIGNVSLAADQEGLEAGAASVKSESITSDVNQEKTEVYFSQNFDKLSSLSGSGLNVVDKGNIITLKTEEESQNKFVYIERTKEDAYFDIALRVDAKKFVMQADISTWDTIGKKSLFLMKDSAGTFNNVAFLNPNGEISLVSGKVVGKVPQGEFVHMAVAVDLEKKSLEVYLGEQLAATEPMANTSFTSPAFLRFQMNGSDQGTTTLGIDNILVYAADAPKEITAESLEVDPKCVYPDDSVALKQLEGKVAFMLFNGAVFANGEKFFPEAPAQLVGDRTMVPVRLVSEAFGLQVDWINDEQKVTIGDDSEFIIGDKNLKVKGAYKEYDTAPCLIGDYAYLPLRVIGEDILGKAVSWDERGFIVIADAEFNPAGEKTAVEEAYNYLLYDRPKAKQILETYNASEAKGQHPKIYGFKEDFDRIREEIKTIPEKEGWANAIIGRANTHLKAVKLEYATPDGLRMSPGYTLHDRVFDLMMAYQLTLDKKYTDRAYFELESGAEFPDWNPKHFLDTADMISAYGLAYDWGYDAWTQEQREFIRNTLKEKGLMAAYNSIYGIDQVYWTAHRHNWNAVCNGAIGIGAMAIMDDEPEFASDLIEKTLRGMEYMLDGFAPDGGWREGTSYWAYTNEYYAPYMAMLDHAMGTTFHYFNIPGVDKTAYYYVAMEGSTSTFNYHNNGGGTPNAPSIFWYAQALNDPSIGMLRAALMKTRGLAGDFYDILWYRPEYAAADFDLPLDMSFREIETGMMRASWTDRDTAYVGYHGGRNNVEHTHYDMGEFIFDQLGVRWAVELGSDDYNMPDYFGVDSVYYRVRTEGHNTYVINPGQSRGQEYVTFCPIVKQESKERGAYAVLDLHSAYPNDTNSAIRGFMLGDNRKSLTVRDEIDKKDGGPLYWFMHTKAEVEIDGNRATLTQDGKQLSFEFVSNDPEAKLYVMDAVPLETSPNPEQQNKNAGIRKLVIQSSKKGKLNLTVKLYPKLEGAVYEGVSDTPIDQWTLPEGSINPPPLLDSILLDEQPLASFEPSQKNYVCMIEDLSRLPVITASSELPVEVVQAQAGSNIAKIVVSDPEDSTNKTLYTITFKVPAKAEVPAGLVRKNQVAIKASANPQQENMDFQAADGDLDTRWSADGDQWIQFDLGETTGVEAVALAWWQGNARVSYFDILVSEDGEDFSQVGSYETSGTTEEFEIFTFAPVQARYVRVLGHGNETSGWNSILEMQVYGK